MLSPLLALNTTTALAALTLLAVLLLVGRIVLNVAWKLVVLALSVTVALYGFGILVG